MAETLGTSRKDISTYAPRIITIKIPVEKIRDVIGPGGKVIRSIVERTGVKIDVEDDGRINIASSDDVAAQKAIAIIQELTATPEQDKVECRGHEVPRAPRVAMRPGCKARRLRIPSVFEGGATPQSGMQRQPNAEGLRDPCTTWAASSASRTSVHPLK